MPSVEQLATTPSATYNEDFYLWTQKMAVALRQGAVSALDMENLAEEIENLGKSDRRALKSRLEILLMHLLKWQFQPNRRSGSWQCTIIEQRLRIQDILTDSPSLKNYLISILPEAHHNAILLAAAETTLPLDLFPKDCPYSIKQILDIDYLLPD
ncbi:DUF29 domain-containing protein [Limnofasciculus baicalensis]|nr:DUF29 domain-containing protein [Limnofasciculus baicalensis]